MITIISRRKFIFHNPDPSKDLLLGGMDKKKTPSMDDACFITNGSGELEQAPDWLNKEYGKDEKFPSGDVDLNQRNLNTFRHAESDGHLMEVAVRRSASSTEDLSDLQAKAEEQQRENQRLANKDILAKEGRKKDAEEVALALNDMSKAQIIDHAKEHYGLELNERSNKGEMIEAVKAKISA